MDAGAMDAGAMDAGAVADWNGAAGRFAGTLAGMFFEAP